MRGGQKVGERIGHFEGVSKEKFSKRIKNEKEGIAERGPGQHQSWGVGKHQGDLVGKAPDDLVGNSPLPYKELMCPPRVLNEDSQNGIVNLQSPFHK